MGISRVVSVFFQRRNAATAGELRLQNGASIFVCRCHGSEPYLSKPWGPPFKFDTLKSREFCVSEALVSNTRGRCVHAKRSLPNTDAPDFEPKANPGTPNVPMGPSRHPKEAKEPRTIYHETPNQPPKRPLCYDLLNNIQHPSSFFNSISLAFKPSSLQPSPYAPLGPKSGP